MKHKFAWYSCLRIDDYVHVTILLLNHITGINTCIHMYDSVVKW